jgi:hypothetical protein
MAKSTNIMLFAILIVLFALVFQLATGVGIISVGIAILGALVGVVGLSWTYAPVQPDEPSKPEHKR